MTYRDGLCVARLAKIVFLNMDATRLLMRLNYVRHPSAREESLGGTCLLVVAALRHA